MSSIIPFSFESTEIRAIANDQGEPWFVASDVAEVLGYRETRDMTRILDDDEAAPHIVRVRSENGVEQDREMTIISESGLYACILKSRRPEAKVFRKWVTGEVLPSLRKTGRYAVPTEATINPAQQRRITDAIHERFPEGKHRSYAWSRFGKHFAIASYKQLPARQVDEAVDYIAQMPLPKSAQLVAPEASFIPSGTRFLAMHTGTRWVLTEVPQDAYVFAAEEMPRLVSDPDYPRAQLPNLLKAVAERMAA